MRKDGIQTRKRKPKKQQGPSALAVAGAGASLSGGASAQGPALSTPCATKDTKSNARTDPGKRHLKSKCLRLRFLTCENLSYIFKLIVSARLRIEAQATKPNLI